MKNDLTSEQRQLCVDLDAAAEQFRLARIQTYHWGTFSDVFDFPIAESGFLFVGPSGSGKSTILDAHAALLTPPRWVDFNVAAREAERHGRDRSLVTYVRGAWAQQTGESGEYLSQYLRSGTTWSAIAETYRNRHGRVVVLAQLLWIRGRSTASTDVKRIYLVLEREIDIRNLEFFAKADFDVRRLKRELPDAFVHDEFSGYQERFRRLLGIDNELALRLLHKTQSAKNLGDLNTFLRDFMLDVPQTFEVADRLVAEFGELNSAHQAVVAARQQIETLEPARDAADALERARGVQLELDETLAGVEAFRERQRESLLQARLSELQDQAEGARQEAQRLAGLEEQLFQTLRELQDRRHGMGGGLIEQLQKQAAEAEEDKLARLQRRHRAADACRTMGWTLPDAAQPFVRLAGTARQQLADANEAAGALEARKDELKGRLRDASEQFQQARAEIAAMERQRSNVDARMLELRAALAAAIGIGEDRLPFVAELLDVHEDERRWQGAIERVLRGFALSLLVDDRHYAAVSSHLNERHLGERLVYLRVMPQQPGARASSDGGRAAAAARAPGQGAALPANSLARKLKVAAGPHAEWLRDQLRDRFDYECTESLQAFRNARMAVTLQGQVKHGPSRHEKDDRGRVDDRSRWVLGFDNRSKRALFEERALELANEIESLKRQIEAAKADEDRQRAQLLACQSLANLTWSEIDVASAAGKIAALSQRIQSEKASRPDLARLDADIADRQSAYDRARDDSKRAGVAAAAIERDIEQLRKRLDAVPREIVGIALTPLQRERLTERYARAGRAITLESIDQVTTQVVRELGAEKARLVEEQGRLRSTIESRFADFNRRWPTESGGLDATIESADDFFAKLRRLQTDGLPRFETRFKVLLREQSDQNLTMLSSRLDQERRAILERLELVNESLQSAEFGPGTHLVIDAIERPLADVRVFRTTLKDALSHSFSDDAGRDEHRFSILSELVRRLSSQDGIDRHWRAQVLDVRQHVEFVARELDSNGVEQEIYRSGAGKSGGQRQKLTATCLAAALRYQLGGAYRALPAYATVVLDEAFDKADAEFTAIAMNIFKEFGFQMIVATPLKSVMTLEPFIGGACYVHIRDRRHSSALMIEYDAQQQRLKLPAQTTDPQHAEDPRQTNEPQPTAAS
ncbi:MAG TPA: SbcC/MukB-like Walker B domain-containing protein [Burkholderiaceae bacterium]|nr:SbcC/MukB-like Walker B domain-containing protein [Burkholderiaceae bacterium]